MRVRKKKNGDVRFDACRELYIDFDKSEAEQAAKNANSDYKKLSLKEIFPGFDKFRVEIGCGKGTFITETAKRNPDAILDLIKGGFKEGMQYFSTYSSDSDVIRITGYLVKKSDIAKLDNGIAVPQANAKWGYYEVKNSKIYERKVRSLNGDR